MNNECLSATVQEKKGQYYTPTSALRALRPNDAIIKGLLLNSLRCAPQPELSGGWPFRSYCRQRAAPRPPVPNGLRTLHEGAARLGCSVRTLRGHIASGTISYVVIGHGKKRPRKMLTDADLDAFIANQTRKDLPTSCPSIAMRARNTGTSTSKCEVIAFSARPNARPGVKPKK
jgi:hypothetical protein